MNEKTTPCDNEITLYIVMIPLSGLRMECQGPTYTSRSEAETIAKFCNGYIVETKLY